MKMHSPARSGVLSFAILAVVSSLGAQGCGESSSATSAGVPDAASDDAADTESVTDVEPAAGSDGTLPDAESESDTPSTDVGTDTGPTDTGATDTGGGDVTTTPVDKTFCVAIRGNGELITAHFAALARLAETFGAFDGVAGGSSGSISAFFTESIHLHPGIKKCGGKACTPLQAGARVGLMFKSLYGYLQAMTERDEAVAVGVLLDVAAKAQAQGIGTLIEDGNLEGALQSLITLLTSADVKDLVNDEVLDLLLESENPLDYVPLVWSAISTLGAFSAESAEIFLRPGLVSFEGFAEKLGRIGSFYAGYGPVDLDNWEAFFDACALPGRGKPWPEVAGLPDGDGSTCGVRFSEMLAAWREGFIPVEGTSPNRINDPVGKGFRSLAITSVFTGAAAAAFKTAYENYLALATWSFTPSFDDVRVGYWGADVHTKAVVANALDFPDLKSQKAASLGPGSWRLAISMSPAEPGLSRAKALPDGSISGGGWPDLAPVLALRNAGCDQVVYLTRRGPDSKFGRAVAALAGVTPEQDFALYESTNPNSSLSLSLREAAGVWCTDWNLFSLTQIPEIMSDAWTAPFELHDETLVPIEGDYPTITEPELGLEGCTPADLLE
ncbi:MAG: hypothetical protein IV100_22595 [Myxococcales bacterium]|nr:hypothetical protein [Myxococcales bacterium]